MSRRGSLRLETANPSYGLGVLRVLIVTAIAALAIIGLANLLTATAAGIGDHLHEAEVLPPPSR